MSKAGERIIKSARQALAFVEGRARSAEYGVHIPDEIDVRTIRRKIGKSASGLFRRWRWSPQSEK